MDWKECESYAPVVIRLGVSMVFLWFGLNQLFDPESFAGFVPDWAGALQLSVGLLISLNGAFEVVFGAALLLGLFIRPVALLLSLHLMGIAFSVGYGDIFVRDVGLSLATFSVFLHGRDRWCLHRKFFRKI